MAKILFFFFFVILIECAHSRFTVNQDLDELADEYDEEEDGNEVKRDIQRDIPDDDGTEDDGGDDDDADGDEADDDEDDNDAGSDNGGLKLKAWARFIRNRGFNGKGLSDRPPSSTPRISSPTREGLTPHNHRYGGDENERVTAGNKGPNTFTSATRRRHGQRAKEASVGSHRPVQSVRNFVHSHAAQFTRGSRKLGQMLPGRKTQVSVHKRALHRLGHAIQDHKEGQHNRNHAKRGIPGEHLGSNGNPFLQSRQPQGRPNVHHHGLGRWHPHQRMAREDAMKEFTEHTGDAMKRHTGVARPRLSGADRENLLRIMSAVDIIKHQLDEMDVAKRLREESGKAKATTVTEEHHEEIAPPAKQAAPNHETSSQAPAPAQAPLDVTKRSSYTDDEKKAPQAREDAMKEFAEHPGGAMKRHAATTKRGTGAARPQLSGADRENLLRIMSAVDIIKHQLDEMDLAKRLREASGKAKATTVTEEHHEEIAPPAKQGAPSHETSSQAPAPAQAPLNVTKRSSYTDDERKAPQGPASQVKHSLNTRDISGQAGALNTLHLCLSKTSNGASGLPLKKTDLTDTVEGIKGIEKNLRYLKRKLVKGFTTLMDQMTDFSNMQRTDIKANGDKIFTLQNSISNRINELKSNINTISNGQLNTTDQIEESLARFIDTKDGLESSNVYLPLKDEINGAGPKGFGMNLQNGLPILKTKTVSAVTPGTKKEDLMSKISIPVSMPLEVAKGNVQVIKPRELNDRESKGLGALQGRVNPENGAKVSNVASSSTEVIGSPAHNLQKSDNTAMPPEFNKGISNVALRKYLESAKATLPKSVLAEPKESSNLPSQTDGKPSELAANQNGATVDPSDLVNSHRENIPDAIHTVSKVPSKMQSENNRQSSQNKQDDVNNKGSNVLDENDVEHVLEKQLATMKPLSTTDTTKLSSEDENKPVSHYSFGSESKTQHEQASHSTKIPPPNLAETEDKTLDKLINEDENNYDFVDEAKQVLGENGDGTEAAKIKQKLVDKIASLQQDVHNTISPDMPEAKTKSVGNSHITEGKPVNAKHGKNDKGETKANASSAFKGKKYTFHNDHNVVEKFKSHPERPWKQHRARRPKQLYGRRGNVRPKLQHINKGV